ncbi:MAG TPA: hypothetical protein VFA67_06815 [Candidatus Sulfotelmatobacter sp.]|nr:hypothetical protein [Candidatus Sulfotelmatobacter sp.]
MPSYQTGQLRQYEPRFLQVAEDVFDLVCRRVPPKQVERHDGSYSVYGDSVKDTAAKIVIWDPEVGRPSRNWPRMRDGVYVWVRANGPLGDAIWGDILPVEMPRMFQRMWRNVTVQIAANPQADFAHFPIMAGDDLENIAALIAACSTY